MLTDSIIKSALRAAPASGGRKTTLTEKGARGDGRLTLVIRATQHRVTAEWYATFWREGARRMAKIGVYPAMSLAEARAKFRVEYAPAIQSGANPKNPYVRRNNRATKRPASVRELFEAYCANLAKRGADSAYHAERMLLKREDAAVKELGEDRPARDITPEDVVSLLSKIYDRGKHGQADITRSYVRAAFSWGMSAAHDYTKQVVTADWQIKANPVDSIPKDLNASQPRSRFLNPAEFRLFWHWLVDQRAQSSTCDVLRLQMLTGQRIKELCRLRVGSFKMDTGVIDLGKTKNTRVHGIPLCRQALEVMRSLTPNTQGIYFPHRFDRHRTILHTGPHKTVQTFLAETKMEPFTPRDLRRTWKTLAGQAGVSKVWRDIYQNHTLPGSAVSAKHYEYTDYIPYMREHVLPKWEAFVEKTLGSAE